MEQETAAHPHAGDDEIRRERHDRAERAARKAEHLQQHNAGDHLDDRRGGAVLKHLPGGLFQLVRLVGVFGQAHEQHGQRGIRDDRRARVIPFREQEPRQRQRHRGQARDRGHRDQQVEPHTLIEQGLGGGLPALAPAAQHSRVYAAHDADRDHREQAGGDRVVAGIYAVHVHVEKADDKVFVDLVEQRDRDGHAHERQAVLEKFAEQPAREKPQPHDRGQAERGNRADACDAVRYGVGGDGRERRGRVVHAEYQRIGNHELEHGGQQAERDRRFHAPELDERGVQDLEDRVAEKHGHEAQIERIMCDSGGDAAEYRDSRADQQIDGCNGGKQAAPLVFVELLADIAGGGVCHPARKDEVSDLYVEVDEIECTDRRLIEQVRIQRRARDDQQALDDLRGQEKHRVARHGVFTGQKRNPRFRSDTDSIARFGAKHK